MPRNGSGVATKPPGTTAIPNTTIASTPYNTTVDDIYMMLNEAAPINAGGTGGNTVEAARASLEVDKKFTYSAKSSGYTALLSDNNTVIRFTANATLALTAAATLGINWRLTVIADGGNVIIDPNSAETIDNQPVLFLANGQSVTLFCDGSAFWSDKGALPMTSAPRGHMSGLGHANNGGNEIATAAGEASSDGATPYLMKLTAGLTKALNAPWSAGTGGGLDTGSFVNGTYHGFLIRNPATGAVDLLWSLSPTAPTLPSGFTQKRRIGSIIKQPAGIMSFIQKGNTFRTSPIVVESFVATALSGLVVVPNVPTGISFDALIYANLSTTSNSTAITLAAGSPGVAALSGLVDLRAYAYVAGSITGALASTVPISTDTSARIQRAVSIDSGSGNATLSCSGWIDTSIPPNA